MVPNDIIKFWFEDLNSKDWFSKNDDLDKLISDRFLETLKQASCGELFQWRSTAHGKLAEIIVLDQFSRNIYRNNSKAFGQDALALILSQEAINAKADLDLSSTQKAFLYMPFMHSESIMIHDEALKLFAAPGLKFNLDFEHKHKNIILRFGRYPHRNEILGRESTPEEIQFLKEKGSSF